MWIIHNDVVHHIELQLFVELRKLHDGAVARAAVVDFFRLFGRSALNTRLDAHQSWYQFRVSMDWPRSDEDRFYLALFSLASKSFVPKAFIRKLLDEREYWKQNVEPIHRIAQATNYAKMAYVAARYFKNGELTWFKIRQYGDLSQLISQ